MQKHLNQTQSIVAVIPAGGFGVRMAHKTPKQYIKIAGKAILDHTLDALLSVDEIDKIIIAIHPSDDYFKMLTNANHPKIKTTIGGASRAESVLAGLKSLSQNEWALVHDAVRPCVDVDDVKKLINTCLTHQKGGILATKITDTIKKVQCDNHIIKSTKTIDREALWAAATPQMFNAEQLKSSITHAFKNNQTVTDEASAIELQGDCPLIVECKRSNIKITYPEDLLFATVYLQPHLLQNTALTNQTN